MACRVGQVAAMLLAAAAVPAAGQSMQGPLGDPAEQPPPANAPARTAHRPHGHSAKRSGAAAGPARDARPEASAPAAQPASRAAHAGSGAGDPVSFGFKWQGSNDTAERTRVQNYGGDAAGTGAAVGLKLHF